ncbi:unnamed protein product [Rhizoctonia solani]|uniref:Hydrolase Mb2248c n=1 Tax=Rhizoctonia solani TaxID=456999 RepID=A0A8H3E8A9_9AGAM|nr:unnamed protein product [Rhizoctonia solani]
MWKKLWIVSTAVGALETAKAAYTPVIHSRQTSNTSTISWAACPDDNSTQCAFFDVPMDYTSPNSTSTVSIFLRKYSATAPVEQQLGSILVNPGGPGGSGSAAVAVLGPRLSTMVDGRYDIIGAVNLTGPPTACHDTEYKQGAPFPHVGGAAETAHVAKLSAIQSSHRAACIENGNYEMLRNSGTVAVVKDMERIVEALGEDGLNYLGYSYGTILGATFAAMRPNLVKRMVLDGVSDAEAYFDGVLEWGRKGIQETPKTLAGFISTCIDAGPTQCALASTKDNKTETVEGLAKRLDVLYTKLGKEPLVVGDSLTGPGIIEAQHVQTIIFSMMYNPRFWSMLTQGLAVLEQGDGRDVYAVINSLVYGAVPEPYNQNVFNRSMQKIDGVSREAMYPVMCGDSPRLNITVEEYADYFREMGKISPMGEQWALLMGGCREWPFRAAETYTGPWTVEKGLNKTRFPILFVSLDADPVTPLASAVKMSRGFGSESGSLLIQQGFGHPSYAHPSLCTIKHVGDYFVNGTVPKNGTHCTPEPGFIYPTNNTQSKRSMLSERDKGLLEAVEEIGRTDSPKRSGAYGEAYGAPKRFRTPAVLVEQPLVVGDSPTGPGIIQAHNVQYMIFALMYFPNTWSALAQALLNLEQGNGQDYYPLLVNGILYGTLPKPYTQNVFNRSMQVYPSNTRESQYPIMCGDSPQLNITIKGYADYFREMGELGPMGEQIALIIGACRGWSFRATERYTGPWTVEKGLNKTRFPILIVNLDADPVTPLPAAVKMS